jgi:hypothetical protein
MKRSLVIGLVSCLAACVAGVALAQYAGNNYHEAGTQRWVVGGGDGVGLEVESGGVINIKAGGAFKIAGVNKTTALTNAIAGTGAGGKMAFGQRTTASAADTIATGLTTVTSCTATLETDPADANLYASCQVGDQSAAPIAGSIIIKTWKTADGTDPTPVAATAFSKKVNWVAGGT